MVTSHLGRPTEGDLKPEDSLAPIARRMSELLGFDVKLVRTGSMASGCAGRSGAAGKLPRQQGREEVRRRAVAEARRAVRRVRE
jgi:hypothetical protein